MSPNSRGWAAVALLTLMVLSGCASHSSKETHSSSSSSATSEPTSTATSTSTGSPPIGTPRHLLLTNCTAWIVFALFPGPTGPGQRPPGWDAPPLGTPTTGVGINAYHCKRLSVGPFERGPVNLLFDAHTNADFPLNCTVSNGNDRIVLGILNSFWIDDGEIAAYLNQTFGLPVRTTEFKETDQPGSPLTSHTWSWGQPASQVTVYDDGSAAVPPGKRDRIFWPHNGGIAELEFQYDRLGPAGPTDNRAASGTFASPMLFASLPGGQYSGPGEWYSQMNQASGTVTQYSDPKCLHPT